MRNRSTVVVYDNASVPQVVARDEHSSCVEVTLDDERTVQLTVNGDGHVLLRAWPSNAYLTENATAASVWFDLPTVEQMVLDGAQVGGLTVHTNPLTERNLAHPDRHGCWYLASDAIKERAEGLRALLARRRNQAAPTA